MHDIRLLVRRAAAIGTMLTAEQLLQVADTLTATGSFYRYRMRLDGRLIRLIEMLAPIEDLGPLGKSITAAPLMAAGMSWIPRVKELAEVRHKLAALEERVQHEDQAPAPRPTASGPSCAYPNATGEWRSLRPASCCQSSPEGCRRRASHE